MVAQAALDDHRAPRQARPGSSHEAPLDGPFPTRARSRPAPPPGLPGPAFGARSRRVAPRRSPPAGAPARRTLRLLADHRASRPDRADPREPDPADARPGHDRPSAPDR